MEPRLLVAYGLILLMAILAVAGIAYRIYHSRSRAYRRRVRREDRAYRAEEAKRDADGI